MTIIVTFQNFKDTNNWKKEHYMAFTICQKSEWALCFLHKRSLIFLSFTDIYCNVRKAWLNSVLWTIMCFSLLQDTPMEESGTQTTLTNIRWCLKSSLKPTKLHLFTSLTHIHHLVLNDSSVHTIWKKKCLYSLSSKWKPIFFYSSHNGSKMGCEQLSCWIEYLNTFHKHEYLSRLQI